MGARVDVKSPLTDFGAGKAGTLFRIEFKGVEA